ncbi:MAG TPA: BglII/BstYI family type II restriction endonuclease [Solirubrobacterales bacterium]|nr:BglII/BstYI family type II restriction endonuclease [Solirubrobacterales bacterium]
MDLTRSFEGVFSRELRERYEFREVRNAAAVIAHTNPDAFKDLVGVLEDFSLREADVLEPGKNEGKIAKRLNQAFRDAGWREGKYGSTLTSRLVLSPYRPADERKATVKETSVTSDGYKIDNVKDEVALDVEWNAKDGNLDRDVAAYRSLYDVGILSAGVMLTRTMNDLRQLGRELGRPKFLNTTTTTNLEKLEPRLVRGDAGGCPLLAVAITARCYEGHRLELGLQ